MVTIRTAAIDDAEELAMLSEELGYSITTQQTISNLNALARDKDEVFVAVHNQKVIGWMGVSYKVSLESPPLCEVHGLVVKKQFRGKGIGKMLIEKAKQWTVAKGIQRLRLRCNIKRIEALSFYQNIGFDEVKQQKVLEIKLDPGITS
jgi:GNAT superfamily N-acetyltransferase